MATGDVLAHTEMRLTERNGCAAHLCAADWVRMCALWSKDTIPWANMAKKGGTERERVKVREREKKKARDVVAWNDGDVDGKCDNGAELDGAYTYFDSVQTACARPSAGLLLVRSAKDGRVWNIQHYKIATQLLWEHTCLEDGATEFGLWIRIRRTRRQIMNMWIYSMNILSSNIGGRMVESADNCGLLHLHATVVSTSAQWLAPVVLRQHAKM